jgi:hypothetical protein
LHIDFGMYSEKMCILLLAEFDHSSHLSILLSLPVQVTVLKWL